MTYVAVTLAALIFLNIYCFEVGKRMVYRSKEYALLEKCQLACDELAQRTRSEGVQAIGSKFVLYRQSHNKEKKNKIELVKNKKKPAAR